MLYTHYLHLANLCSPSDGEFKKHKVQSFSYPFYARYFSKVSKIFYLTTLFSAVLIRIVTFGF